MEYQRTFLRSALARDPFALGDMGPEDVLRIESEFPNLFTPSDEPSTEIIDKKINKASPPLQHQSLQPLQNNISEVPQKEQVTKPPEVGQGQAKNRPATIQSQCQRWESHKKSTLVSNANKKDTNKDCKAKPFTRPKTPTNACQPQTPIASFAKPLKVTRSPYYPSFRGLISIDELKKALREILHENPNLSTNLRNSSSVPDYEHARKLIQEEYIRKSYLKRNRDEVSSMRSLYDWPTTPQNRLKKFQQNSQPPETTPGFTKCSAKVSKSPKKLLASASAPGFLRQGVPKRSAPLPLKKSKLSAKGMQFSPSKSKLGKSGKVQETLEPLPSKPKVQENNDEEKELDTKDLEREITSTQQIFMRGTGVGEEVLSSSSEDSKEKSCTDPFISYKQMNLTRNLATNYEKLGLLKKKIPNYGQKQNIERNAQTMEKIVQTEESFAKKESNQALENVSSSREKVDNSNLLQTIAKELIYVEIMKHLNEIQQQEMEERQKQENSLLIQDVDPEAQSVKSTVLNSVNRVENLGFDRLSVIQEISEINLTTPSLSKSKSSNKEKAEKSQQKDTIPTPITPDLSSSSCMSKQANCAVKDSPWNANDATDCSEISDFVLSISEKEHFKTPTRILEKDSSSHLSTPQMSVSSNKIAHRNRSESKHRTRKSYKSPKTPASISSSSNKSSPPKKHETGLDNKVDKTFVGLESNDTFANISPNSKLEGVDTGTRDTNFEAGTPSSASTSIQKDSPQSQTMHTLSEGEFIGSVYKSLGEVSLCCQPPTSQPKISREESIGSSTIHFLTNNSLNRVRLNPQEGVISIGEFL